MIITQFHLCCGFCPNIPYRLGRWQSAACHLWWLLLRSIPKILPGISGNFIHDFPMIFHKNSIYWPVTFWPVVETQALLSGPFWRPLDTVETEQKAGEVSGDSRRSWRCILGKWVISNEMTSYMMLSVGYTQLMPVVYSYSTCTCIITI